MNFFRHVAEQIPEFRELVRNLKSNPLPSGETPPVLVTGLSHVHKAHFSAALSANPEEFKTPILVLVETEREALRLCEDINALLGANPNTLLGLNPAAGGTASVGSTAAAGGTASVGSTAAAGGIGSAASAAVYPAKDINLGDFEVNSREYEYRRLNVLSKLLSNNSNNLPTTVVSTPEAAGQLTISPETLSLNTVRIKQGDELNSEELYEKLINTGFSRCDMVEGAGQFSVRGAIIDIFAVNNKNPVRIELWGDTVDSLGFFDLDTQRRIQNIEEVNIAPSLEDLGEKYVSLFEYINNCIVLESVNCAESYRAASLRHEEDLRLYVEKRGAVPALTRRSFMLTRGEYKDTAGEKTRAYFDAFMRSASVSAGKISASLMINARATQLSSWSGEYKVLCRELTDYFKKGYAVAVFAGTEKAARTLAQDLKDDNFPADFSSAPKKIYAKRAYILTGVVGAGYDYPDAKCAMLSLARSAAGGSADAYRGEAASGMQTRRYKKKRRGEEIRSLTDISAGDYVVHQNYGIGIFEGVKKLTSDDVSKDYIKIKYAGTDALYVPVTQLDMISRYIGNTDSASLKLNKLHSDAWQKTKAKAKAAASELAEELIALYSKRLKSKGHEFPADNGEQIQFEEHFNYIETDDQLRCIEEIKADMQTAKPMDRLLCGDVGFGKTEVALRGAFKCVMDGKQCALLCPTTVLAWQHYQTAIKRMEGFPLNIELLSRFRSAREIKQVLEKIKSGVVDLVIGTHRLVQSDVKFHNLGLVIIDEEQRFGVNHKEKFKEMFAGVDVLTLSATPIPRTLNMAMSGIRDMSVINTPPQDRQPVTTYVIEHDAGIIAQAINKEMRRNGQIYYIHNRIETITDCAAALNRLVPDARIGIAHGKISEDELLEVWRKLLDGEIDILVCTTLIETGVDVPNVNTLIIENADRMGLAQLHQLRGRVGRTNKRAYAYFMFKRGKVLSEISAKRLNAIREFTQFGSGFNIAMRDLEIRGAGSILGARQSGHLSAVGYDMYLKLLNEAVSEKKSGKSSEPNGEESPSAHAELTESAIIDVKTDAFIPESYISNAAQRISCYKRIAEIRSEEDALDVTDELIDRYGEPPKPVAGLIEAAGVRNMAGAAGISEILQDGGVLKIHADRPDMEGVSRAVGALGDRVGLDFTGTDGKSEINVRLIKGEDPLKTARIFLEAYSAVN